MWNQIIFYRISLELLDLHTALSCGPHGNMGARLADYQVHVRDFWRLRSLVRWWKSEQRTVLGHKTCDLVQQVGNGNFAEKAITRRSSLWNPGKISIFLKQERKKLCCNECRYARHAFCTEDRNGPCTDSEDTSGWKDERSRASSCHSSRK